MHAKLILCIDWMRSGSFSKDDITLRGVAMEIMNPKLIKVSSYLEENWALKTN
jgi:hypothetical protein